MGFSVQNAEAKPEQAGAAAAAGPAGRKPENAVLVFGAGGRLGRLVVKKLLEGARSSDWISSRATEQRGARVQRALRANDPTAAPPRGICRHLLTFGMCRPTAPLSPLARSPPRAADGWNVVAAARDAAKTEATLKPLVGEASAWRLFVRGGVDVTNPATLNAALFEGVSKAVVATGAVFGMDKDGKMGYLDNMTSERVDKLGSENVAAAAKKFLKQDGADGGPRSRTPA